MDMFSTNMMKKKKTKGRFSNEQIRSLESIFEFDSKLEPTKKLQIAKELGLQPQQVVIWFQNRRARWKSKQLERDYGSLKANYDDLAARFESLKEEKHSLATQLQKLGDDQIRNTPEENGSCDLGLAEKSTNGNVDNKEPEGEPEKKPTLPREGLNPTVTSSKNENSTSMEYYRDEEEPEYMSVLEPAYEVLTSHQNWRNLESSDLVFDQSSCSSSSQWWEFWP